MSLKFKDLTTFDLNLIKSNAIYILINTSITDRYEALADTVVSCIKSKGYDIQNEPKDLIKKLSMECKPKLNDTTPGIDDVDSIIARMFIFLQDNLKKDENRLSTWSSPKAAWYTHSENNKKSWQI